MQKSSGFDKDYFDLYMEPHPLGSRGEPRLPPHLGEGTALRAGEGLNIAPLLQ